MVDFGIACGEEKDGDLGEVADFSAEVEAGEIGEADIKDREVGSVTVEMIESFLCGGDVGHREVFGFQGVNQGVRDGGFIFNNQDGGHWDRS